MENATKLDPFVSYVLSTFSGESSGSTSKTCFAIQANRSEGNPIRISLKYSYNHRCEYQKE